MSDAPYKGKEQLIHEYQTTMQQLDIITRQLAELKLDISELTETIKNLESLPGDEIIYKRIGVIHFQEKVSKVLDERREKLEVRKLNEERLKNQEKRIKDSAQSLETELRNLLGEKPA